MLQRAIFIFLFVFIGSTIPSLPESTSSSKANAAETSSGTDAPKSRFFEQEKVYDRYLFETEAQCEAVRERMPWFNCKQWIRFFPDGTVKLLLTDTPHDGTYVIQGSVVYADILRGEVETSMAFEVREEEAVLFNPFTEREWKLRKVEPSSDSATNESWTYEDIITHDARERLRESGLDFGDPGSLAWRKDRNAPNGVGFGREWYVEVPKGAFGNGNDWPDFWQDEGSTKTWLFSSARLYINSRAQGKACVEARQKDENFSCSRWVQFSPNGDAQVMWGAGVEQAKYLITGDIATVIISSEGDAVRDPAPRELKFFVAPAQTRVELKSDSSTWNLWGQQQ